MPDASIRTRLALAFSLVLGLLLAVAAVALHRADAFSASMSEFVDHRARLALLAQRANQHAQDAAIQLLRLLQTPDRERRVPLYAAMDEAIAASDAAVGGIERASAAMAMHAELDRLVALRQRYGELFQETVELIELEGLVAARAHFETRTEAALHALLGETLNLTGLQQERMQAEVAQLEQAAERARGLIAAISLGALLAGGLLSYFIARGIAAPVREAVAAAEAIAGGDYGHKVPDVRGKEVGALMRALDAMRVSIAGREARIARMAYVDTLTDLPNRTRFMERLDAAMLRGRGALIVLDVDRFAPINSALGHAVGDRILREIAARLDRVSGHDKFVARLGGDEFAVLVEGADGAQSAVAARAILAALRQPVIVDGQRLDIDASLGIAQYPEDGDTTTVLLRRADRAMAAAKRRHDGFAHGAEFGAESPHEQLALIGEMRDALTRDEFVLHFQPKVELSTGRIAGAEALLRWRHPERGLVPPGRFIPFAEQTGFVREITPWVLEQAVALAADWHGSGTSIVLSANISTLDLLNPGFVEHLQHLLRESALPPDRLCLEITESALMDEPALALRRLRELAALGLKLSIDDYGSGQASLAYVKNLPVDELKIDRDFVARVDDDSRNAAIVRSTILLCRELGLVVVAEGAETPGEVGWLHANGCDVVQGFGVARPMPADEFMAWAHARARQAFLAPQSPNGPSRDTMRG